MVRIGQRDLGLGAGGLAAIRALVVAGGDELGDGVARNLEPLRDLALRRPRDET